MPDKYYYAHFMDEKSEAFMQREDSGVSFWK